MLKDFNYYKVDSLDQALELLTEKDNVKILAGGTDLIVNMQKGIFHPESILDIKNITEFSELKYDENGLFIGAAVTCTEVKENKNVKSNYPMLSKTAGVLASNQIRNRATVVGNICTSSPGADMAPPLLALDSEVVIASQDGERRVALEEFFTGVKQNVLKDDEIVVGIQVAPNAEDGGSKYTRKSRINGPDLSACGVAGYMSKKEKTAKFSYGAVAVTPILIDASELVFESDLEAEASLAKLLEQVDEAISPISDVRSTEKYRRKMAKVYTERIFRELWEEGE